MQQLFRLLIFLNQPNMFWATHSPILRSIFWLYIQFLVQCTTSVADRSAAEAVHCPKSCMYSQKVRLRMGDCVARNMLGWFEKINKQKICCILLVVYFFVLMMHGHTNVKLPYTVISPSHATLHYPLNMIFCHKIIHK